MGKVSGDSYFSFFRLYRLLYMRVSSRHRWVDGRQQFSYRTNFWSFYSILFTFFFIIIMGCRKRSRRRKKKHLRNPITSFSSHSTLKSFEFIVSLFGAKGRKFGRLLVHLNAAMRDPADWTPFCSFFQLNLYLFFLGFSFESKTCHFNLTSSKV